MRRLTKNPEVRYSQGTDATAIGRYSIAVNRFYKRDEEPEIDFFNIVAFGSRDEFTGKYFHKGMQIAIVGELRNNIYTDRDGHKRTATDIMVIEQDYAESRSQNQQNNQPDAKSAANPDFVPAEADNRTLVRSGRQLKAREPRQLGSSRANDDFTPIDTSLEGEEDLPF